MTVKNLQCLIILSAAFYSSVSPDINSQLCFYATPRKSPGDYSFANGKADIIPFYFKNEKNKDACNENCRINDTCYATSFDHSNNCSFYTTKNFSVSTNILDLQYSKWEICNNWYQPVDGRCNGSWITYPNQQLTHSHVNILVNITLSKYYNCRKLCLENPMCGYINRIDKTCLLISRWPVQNLKMNDSLNHMLDVWTCVDNYVNKLELKEIILKPIDQKCTGYWTITDRNKTLTKDQSRGLNFQTQAFQNCLDECNLYSDCSTAWFSLNYSMCILKDIEPSDVHLSFDNMEFITFDWICVKNDSHDPPLNKDEKRYKELGMKCYTIVNDSKLFIGKDKCGHCPHESKFVKCFESNQPKWNIRDSCLINQSYWSFPPTKVYMNITGVIVDNLIKVYTGLQLYWMAFSDGEILEDNYLKCRHFNATRSIEKLNILDIIKKKDWYARPPNGDLHFYQNIPTKILITASQEPLHSCKTKAACIDVLRGLQEEYFHGSGITPKFSDIPYNFMIDDNGHIYECRGWKHACAAVYPYNDETMCIGYIGWFAHKYPTELYLNHIKKFIDYSVKYGFVNNNYELFIHQDLTRVKIKRNLKIVIKNFYRYKGFLPEDCKNISTLLVGLNFIIFLAIFPIVYVLYKFFNFKPACKNCNLLSENKNNIVQLFPSNENLNQVSNPKINFESTMKHYLLYEKSFIFQPEVCSKSIKIIKIWFFNRFLEAMNSRYDENNLTNFLKNTLKEESSVFIYQIESHKTLNIITVMSNVGVIHFLKQLLENRSCICLYFNVEAVDFSNVPMEIQIIK